MMHERPSLKKVVFSYELEQSLLAAVREALPGTSVVVAEKDALQSEIAGAQLVIGGRIHDDALANAADLVWQHVTWAGVESIISDTLKDRGIVLTNSRGVSAPNMAEHVLAMMLALGRAIPHFVRNQDERKWADGNKRPPFSELAGTTVVLLGTGAIGRETAKRLRSFGCRIIGARRRPVSMEEFDDVIGFDDLPDFLGQTDHVVSSLPMTPHTKKLFSADLIREMKPGAYLFNIGRGGTVDQDALIEALENGHLGGAGLDVTDPEPLPKDSPLWSMPNVLITGHTSGGSPNVAGRVRGVLLENLRRYQNGDELLNVIDLDQGY